MVKVSPELPLMAMSDYKAAGVAVNVYGSYYNYRKCDHMNIQGLHRTGSTPHWLLELLRAVPEPCPVSTVKMVV